MRENDVKKRTSLHRLLVSNGIPSEEYSLDGYADDCVCLIKRDGCWVVFSGVRGHEADVSSYASFYDAGVEIIGRLAYDPAQKEKMISMFAHEAILPSKKRPKRVAKTGAKIHRKSDVQSVAVYVKPAGGLKTKKYSKSGKKKAIQ